MINNYVAAASWAKRYGVSRSTIQRRIREGKLFPGAKKLKRDFGEIWVIPRSEAEAASLKEISPKLYQERYKSSKEFLDTDTQRYSIPKSTIESLEERIATLERLFMKHLAQ